MLIWCCSLPRFIIFTPLILFNTWSTVVGFASWMVFVLSVAIATGACERFTASPRDAVTTTVFNKEFEGEREMIPEASSTGMVMELKPMLDTFRCLQSLQTMVNSPNAFV